MSKARCTKLGGNGLLITPNCDKLTLGGHYCIDGKFHEGNFEMDFEEFADHYCERQQQTPEGLKGVLNQQRARFNPTGWMLLECHQFDSSKFGRLTILPYGPNNSYKELPPREQVVMPDGLASSASVVAAILLAENLPS